MLSVISLALLLTGFSIFSAITLALTHFSGDHYRDQVMSRIMGLILLLALSGLQLAHFQWLYLDLEWAETLPYRMILFTVAPAFYLFCRPLLRPDVPPAFTPILLWHALPILIAALLPQELALPLAFLVGAGYLLWLALSLFALRTERASFRLEMFLLGTVFMIAVAVSLLGLLQTVLPEKLFFSLYSIAIGMAFVLVQTALGFRPRLSTEVRETAQAAYAVSTLTNIDCDATLSKLNDLMQRERFYIDSKLSLPNLAEQLCISTHQLSELMNTRLGKGFSRYLREQRVDAAKQMLHEERSASVLSVALSVGFSSQSTFYEAFREIEGMTPGQYRKLQTEG
ncbi:AraC family transcriptional regulator [Solemya pervernicosa gill symbiont]|uniref:AraC family transcriptional regulator n=1 Tax=Solemya pervernicosa gill symbiont TaxID=642797 RepID=A0A1T2KZ60_9GAMM|nr:helix-turn-helix domain-containing protein [Solemya pervernicosa gill symbiont]OOZ38137.1 AraC family transcriptional regulator [Solemya pervernicosa gill symbiont]